MQIGFPGILTLIFITLKLTGYIAWPWLWVLSPLWIGLAIFLALYIPFMLIFFFAAAKGNVRVTRK